MDWDEVSKEVSRQIELSRAAEATGDPDMGQARPARSCCRRASERPERTMTLGAQHRTHLNF